MPFINTYIQVDVVWETICRTKSELDHFDHFNHFDEWDHICVFWLFCTDFRLFYAMLCYLDIAIVTLIVMIDTELLFLSFVFIDSLDQWSDRFV